MSFFFFFSPPKENLRGKAQHPYIHVTCLIFGKRLKGRDFLKQLNSCHRSPTDLLIHCQIRMVKISTKIVHNKGRKHNWCLSRVERSETKECESRENISSKAQSVLFS